MSGIQMLESKIFKYEFEMTINNSVKNVWQLLSSGINSWWMNDFRVLGENSTMSLNLQSGGALIEIAENGTTLEWYRVQMCMPGEFIYLVGYMAPDWGGPTVSMLKLALKSQGEGCVLTVSDALLGNVTDSKAINAESGWKLLFESGLKSYAEQ